MTFVLLETVCFRMKGFVFLLLAITCLLVLPVSSSYACGSNHTLSKIDTRPPSPPKAYCSAGDHQKPGSEKKTCGHSCDGSACNCAHGPSVFALKTPPAPLSQITVFTISRANSWFFKESTPKPVYLPLWMPPNLDFQVV